MYLQQRLSFQTTLHHYYLFFKHKLCLKYELKLNNVHILTIESIMHFCMMCSYFVSYCIYSEIKTSKKNVLIT